MRDVSEMLAESARWLHRLGFAPGTAGNLSVRAGEDRVLATPTGCSKGMLTADDIVEVDMDGKKVRGTREVTSEIGMHLAIYERRPDVRAVVHGHPPIATAFACCGVALDQPICSEIMMTLGSIPLAPYATTGTASLAQSLAPYVPGHDAILLANHGAVCYGLDLQDAVMKMETLEHFAQVTLHVKQIGHAKPLEENQILELLEAKQRYLRRAAALSIG